MTGHSHREVLLAALLEERWPAVQVEAERCDLVAPAKALAAARRAPAARVERDSLAAVAARRRDLLRGTAGPAPSRPGVVARSA